MCFLISGCSVDYQLEIINGNFNTNNNAKRQRRTRGNMHKRKNI